MRLAFMGTPEFAIKPLSELISAGHEIVAVYSQPPAARGRGQVLTPSPVHQFAQLMGLDVRTPASMKSREAIAEFQSLELDAAVVVAYGQILKSEILDHPPLGCFNLHASLLPRWRGAAPIQRALMAGDHETGIEVMRMTPGLDEGPVILGERIAIRPEDTAATLHDRLAHIGASLLPIALAAVARGAAEESPQLGAPTYARKITPDEARIDWTRPARELDWHVRGLSPFPGAWTTMEGPNGPQRLKLLMSRLEAAPTDTPPGTVLDGPEFRIATTDGILVALKAQREGKATQAGNEFLRGSGLKPGDRLG